MQEFFCVQAFVLRGIGCCVTHLYVRKKNEQVRSGSCDTHNSYWYIYFETRLFNSPFASLCPNLIALEK